MTSKAYPTLFGGQTNSPVGYCYYHKKHLTVKQLKRKDCLKRQCPCLKRQEQHPFWRQRDERQALRRIRKERLNTEYERRTNLNETFSESTAESAQQDPAETTS